ncbi:hypothetical protein CR513_24606, partial [Mucuna pruriens]
MTSDFDESQAQINYLVDASYDELGLPPARNSSTPKKKNEEAESVQLWEFEDQIPRHDPFRLLTPQLKDPERDGQKNPRKKRRLQTRRSKDLKEKQRS